MDLSKILSISGKPDLYKHIAQSKNGIIVESLNDGKRINAFSTMRISALQDIAIYTEGEDVPLATVYRTMFKQTEGKEAPSHKSDDKTVTDFFEKVLPEYDKERVYISDIKRALKWYNLLISHNLVDDIEPEVKADAPVDDSLKAEAEVQTEPEVEKI